MPYSKSRSRVNFENNQKKLANLAKKASYKNSGYSYEHTLLINQSVIFLLCASIEEYIKNFFEDLFYEYKSQSAELCEIPKNSRALCLLENNMQIYRRHQFNGDEAKAIRDLQVDSNNFAVINDNKIFENELSASIITNNKKYPSKKNLKVLYNRIGINNIFHEINKRGKKDYTSQLESFLNIREAISHQAPPTLTISDVERHFNNIKDIINQIDRSCHTHILNISKADYWPSWILKV